MVNFAPVRPLLLAFALLVAPAAPHDFYISILTIRHNDKEHTLDLTWRMTAHDIEHALEPLAALKLGSDKEYPKADSLLNDYLQHHLQLELKDRPLTLTWIGKELESENLYCYLQVEGIENPDGLTVANDLLQEVFAEQQNMVHLETGDRTLSHAFLRGAPAFAFTTK